MPRTPSPRPTFKKFNGRARIPEPTKTLNKVKEAWSSVERVPLSVSPCPKSSSDLWEGVLSLILAECML